MPNDMTDAAKTVLALSRVSAWFPDDLSAAMPAIRDISFSINRGEFVSISGPSGAGKSTLLRAILGLLPIQSGTIVRHYERPAMVFQNYALFPWLSALDNAAFGLKMAGVGKLEREKAAREVLEQLGLSGFEQHYPSGLSGGQRQRVGLARALAISPDLLIMDEPFSNLDTITAEALKADILKVWRQYGMTILMVNHLIPDAIELSDEILIMSAHPGEIKKAMPITLPRPRDTRSPSFYKHVDELTSEIRRIS
jgi:ABC-type nitrate/sulfonate/bicarbonate transport system ATPase subunit